MTGNGRSEEFDCGMGGLRCAKRKIKNKFNNSIKPYLYGVGKFLLYAGCAISPFSTVYFITWLIARTSARVIYETPMDAINIDFLMLSFCGNMVCAMLIHFKLSDRYESWRIFTGGIGRGMRTVVRAFITVLKWGSPPYLALLYMAGYAGIDMGAYVSPLYFWIAWIGIIVDTGIAVRDLRRYRRNSKTITGRGVTMVITLIGYAMKRLRKCEPKAAH